MNSTSLGAQDEVFNLEELLARCIGNVGIAERILSKFQERFDVDLQTLEQGCDQSDASAIAQAAHRIKGAAANVAAPALYELASQIERLGRAGRVEAVPAEIEQLRYEWARFVEGVSEVDFTQCIPD